MHTLTLITVDIPDTTQTDAKLDQGLTRLAQALFGAKDNEKASFLQELLTKRLNCRRDAFSIAVDNAVAEKLEPYCECTEDKRFLEFVDQSDEIRDEYENGSCNFIRLPQGTMVPERYYGRFCIREGKVFQRQAGPLRHEKRTKKSKKMKAFEDYPFKKVYKSLDEFATDFYGSTYHEDRKAYGYYTNPNSFWDWYSIGGRWPFQFLVKESCPEYSIGERGFDDDDRMPDKPEGYVWAVAARKKDIEWQALYDWSKQRMTERFYQLEKCFAEQKLLDGMLAQISEQGIGFFGDLYYVAGESLNENLRRFGYVDDMKYHASCGAYVDHDTAYCDRFDILGPHNDREGWCRLLENFVEKADDNAVIVGVDCHV